MRSDGLLLASLILRRDPARKAAVRSALAELGAQPSLTAAGQALIRAKVIGPQDFVLLQEILEGARRPCLRCGTPLVLLRPLRCARCGARNPAAEDSDQQQQQTRRATRRGASERNEQTQPQTPQRRPGSEGEPGSGWPGQERRAQPRRKKDTARDASSDPENGSAGGARQPERIGPYRVLGRVGHGGMGVIYRIQDKAGRVLALKRLRRDASQDARARFRREAEAIARLKHPAIVGIHDVGDQDGLPYYTMDYVEGRELQEVRHELPREALLGVVAKVARGLHYAHEQGIIHRDVKPHNVMVDGAGEPRIADFGLARDLGRSSLTEVGDLVGTPLFMAPEQLRGDPDAIDRRTDVYALGVVLYEALTKKMPVEATNFFELQERVRSHVPDPPSDHDGTIPPELDRIVLKALEKRQDDRYLTAEDLAQDLERFLRGESVEARGVQPRVRLARALRERLLTPWGVAALSVVAVLVLALAIGLAYHQRTAAAARARAALEQRQGAALALVQQARDALERAHQGDDRARSLEAAAEALRLADQAVAAGEALGPEAPPQLAREVEAARLGARRLRANVLAGGGPADREAARALYRELLPHTGDPELRLALGRLELEAGHCREALEQLNEVLTRDAARIEAFYFRAEAHRRAGAAPFALLDYERALADRARLVAVRPARVLVGRALAHLDLEELMQAHADLEEAQRLDPREPLARLARSALLSAEHKPEAALEELVFGARTFPDEAALRLACGQAWVRVGDRERALAELDAALARTTDPMALVSRARLHALLGEDDAAERDLRAALAHTRPGEAARVALRLVQARLARAQGRPPEALAALEEVLPERAAPARHLLEAAELLLAGAAGDRSSAASLVRAHELAQRAQRLQRDDRRATLALARAAAQGGDPVAARALLRPVLSAHPDDAEATTLEAQLLEQGPEHDAAEAKAREAQRLAVNAAEGLDLDVGGPLREALSSLLRGRRLAARAAPATPAYARSLLLLRRATTLAPWLAAGHLALAEALARASEGAPALAALQEALQRGLATVPALRLQAKLLAERGDHPGALRALAAALERVSETTPTERRLRAALLLARARSRLATDEQPQALIDLDAATRLDPLLLEAFEVRAQLRADAGNAQGAEEDRRQVFVLREGYVQVYERVKAEAWRAARGVTGNHVEGIRVLGPAFEVVSPERDPARCAELHLIRAYMRVRSLRLDGAMIDWAALVELAPTEPESFRQLYDEAIVFQTGERVNLRMEPILQRVIAQRDVQDEVDPDFLQAFVAFAHHEFAGNEPCPPERLRAGLSASERYLERRPAHPGMLLLRAALLLADRQPGPALRAVLPVLEERKPPPFAHFVLARIQNAQRDRQGALRSLERAIEGGYDVFDEMEKDPALSEVRALPGYASMLAVGRARSYLRQVARAEELADRDAQNQRLLWAEIQASASAGLRFGLPHLAHEGTTEVLGRLFLARARQHARLGKTPLAARDLAAALELAPELLCDAAEMRAATRSLRPLAVAEFQRARPVPEEQLPTPLREAIPVVLRLLFGADTDPPDPESLSRARSLLERAAEKRPALGPLIAPLRQAQGNPTVALRIAREVQGSPALRHWMAARALVALGKPEDALAELHLAKDAGLIGPLDADPGLGALARDERVKNLFPPRTRDPAKVWQP
ncbi:MAG: protein kinase [Planctomycetota bacterium]